MNIDIISNIKNAAEEINNLSSTAKLEILAAFTILIILILAYLFTYNKFIGWTMFYIARMVTCVRELSFNILVDKKTAIIDKMNALAAEFSSTMNYFRGAGGADKLFPLMMKEVDIIARLSIGGDDSTMVIISAEWKSILQKIYIEELRTIDGPLADFKMTELIDNYWRLMVDQMNVIRLGKAGMLEYDAALNAASKMMLKCGRSLAVRHPLGPILLSMKTGSWSDI